MNSILFFLALVVNALYANVDMQPEQRAKSVYSSSRQSYWADQQEEMEQKKRKKYRLGNTAGKEKGANKRQLVLMTTSSTEDKIRLSSEPSRYTPKRDEGDLQLLPDNNFKDLLQVRHPHFLPQHPAELVKSVFYKRRD